MKPQMRRVVEEGRSGTSDQHAAGEAPGPSVTVVFTDGTATRLERDDPVVRRASSLALPLVGSAPRGANVVLLLRDGRSVPVGISTVEEQRMRALARGILASSGRRRRARLSAGIAMQL